jgi:short-subunit dehydrogenase
VTILINNAGIMPQHEFLKHTEKEIRMIFEVNVLAHFWIFQAFLPKMIENNNGHIVALSSMAGLMGSRNLVPYCGSKFAVRGFMEAMSEELRATSNGQSKIKFTTIFPYAINTGLFRNFKVRFENLMPVIEPKDAAAAIVSAQRKGLQEFSIPRDLLHTSNFFRIFPIKANLLIRDFLEAYVESDQ